MPSIRHKQPKLLNMEYIYSDNLELSAAATIKYLFTLALLTTFFLAGFLLHLLRIILLSKEW